MSLDPFTEIISRFIGHLHIAIEDLRQRSDFDAFLASSKLIDDIAAPAPGAIEFNVPYLLDGFTPDGGPMPLIAAATPLPFPIPLDAPQQFRLDAGASLTMTIARGPSNPGDDAITDPTMYIRWSQDGPLMAPAPNSIVAVTYQAAILTDDDLLVFTDAHLFTSVTAAHVELDALVEIAESLGVTPLSAQITAIIPTLEDGMQFASVMQDAGVLNPDVSAAETVVIGAAVTGTFIDGAAIAGSAEDSLPVFDDLLPAALQPNDDDDAPAALPARSLNYEKDGAAAGSSDYYAVDPGHAVVTGANMTANMVAVASAWVDAPVIAVRGDALNLTSISQVNVLADVDLSFAQDAGVASQSLNAAHVSTTSSETPSDPGSEPGIVADLETPSHTWAITTIDGDLTFSNIIQQYIFSTDFDRIEVTFRATATSIAMGENQIFNAVALKALGYHYDLIVVDGDMVTMNAITQTNVLLDNDVVAGALAAGTTISTSDNLQLNTARIETQGTDTVTPVRDGFAAAMAELDAGRTTGLSTIADDASFSGKDLLTALHVKGDLIKVNAVEQVNVLGDSDQVHLALADFAAGLSDTATITIGSNAQLNAASIQDFGRDSIIMAAQNSYSDALIYQANLTDSTAPPDQVALTPIVNEALAFLADGMLDTPDDPGFAPLPVFGDLPGSADVMQSVLA
ncbi:hypothetical protein [Pseudoruegeria sp. SK021]|uniref:hypothetical protein n=1 Tax=Pseudoruegeria sp. SK021 TaxID=1933035 RepID=UPI000A21E929|nr:hypothetical protein [Pseudoruegeria sp. SK021]OSP54790.1 hypothetical protein BV911_10740 [Pseudoruegeria sp. SK021]